MYATSSSRSAIVRGLSLHRLRASATVGTLAILGALVLPMGARADSTGELSPGSSTGGFSNSANLLVCDNAVGSASSNNTTQTFSDFGVSLPGTAIIEGIQVRVRANDGSANNRKVRVSLSWNGGTTYTAPLSTRNFRRNTALRDYVVGGSAVLWGRTWTASEFSNANFRVRALATKGTAGSPVNLDCIPVTVFYRVPGAPSLNLSKSDSPDPVQPGQDITYTIVYSNTGESTATNVIVSDVVPTNTTFVSASPAPTSAPSVGGTGTVTWNVSSLAAGGSGVVTLVVKTGAALPNNTLITNASYTIASDQNPATGGNAVATTVSGTIALTLTKTDSPDPVAPGGTLTYVLTIANGGTGTSTNIIVNEAFDGNVSYTAGSYTSTCAGISEANDTDGQWTIPILVPGGSCTVTISTTVVAPLADGVLLLNTADLVDDANSAAEASAVTTVLNPVVCGDGVVGSGEACDLGAGVNGTAGACCTAGCQLRAAGGTCRPSAGACDTADTCTGSSPICPADAKSSAPCRPAAGICDGAESCDGFGNDCPADTKSTAQCRASGGVCDVAEVCDGLGDDCPADAKSTAECRASGGVCDLAESCDGVDNACPTDAKSTAQCRASGGACDVAEVCDGVGSACPADAKSTAECRASGGVCDVAEACDGVNNACPIDAKSTAQCRAAGGGCDIAESCDGVSDDCPTDAVEPSSTVCRTTTVGETCDVADTCDGTNKTCPADAVLPNGTTCRLSAAFCDVTDVCNGSSKLCPSDAKSTAVCRPSAGVCDVAEICDGANNDCPTNAFVSDGTSCDDTLYCNGMQACAGGVCGGGTSPCAMGESCDETGNVCFSGDCPVSPSICRTADKNKVLIRNNTSDNGKDKLIWTWTRGAPTTQTEFGDPTTTANYALCFYAGAPPTLLTLEQVNVPPGGSKWAVLGSKGYKYKDQGGTNDGITKIILKGGDAGKSKALVKGKGANLPDFDGALPLATPDLPLLVQLRNKQNGICWGGSFATPKKNLATQFSGKAP